MDAPSGVKPPSATPAADVETPGSVAAKSLKSCFTFIPTFALVSVNMVLSSFASA